MKSTLYRLFGAVALAATLSACSTTTPVAPTIAKPDLKNMLSKAAEAASAGQKEKAITIWKETATAFPTDKTPWVNMAQTRYDAGQYGEAILHAQEILVRDPNDKLANSIIAISGLRLSTRALSDLSRQNHLSGSLRTESQDLAKLLRESLGETVLVPPTPAPVATAAARPVTRSKKGAAKAASSDGTSAANPFSVLK